MGGNCFAIIYNKKKAEILIWQTKREVKFFFSCQILGNCYYDLFKLCGANFLQVLRVSSKLKIVRLYSFDDFVWNGLLQNVTKVFFFLLT